MRKKVTQTDTVVSGWRSHSDWLPFCLKSHTWALALGCVNQLSAGHQAAQHVRAELCHPMQKAASEGGDARQ